MAPPTSRKFQTAPVPALPGFRLLDYVSSLLVGCMPTTACSLYGIPLPPVLCLQCSMSVPWLGDSMLVKQHYGSDWAKDQAEGFYSFYSFYHDFSNPRSLSEHQVLMRCWSFVIFFFFTTHVLLLLLAFIDFMYFALQLLYEMCYINKVLLTYLLTIWFLTDETIQFFSSLITSCIVVPHNKSYLWWNDCNVF